MSAFTEQIHGGIVAHTEWKGRLRKAIAAGTSDYKVADVRTDNRCDFGKWLYGEGKQSFPSAAQYEQVRGLHAEFHTAAAGVLALVLSGDATAAAKALEFGSPYAKSSGELVYALTRLSRAAA